MKITSKYTGVTYNDSEIVKIKNPLQSARYTSAGCSLLDMYVDDYDGRWAWIFYKREARSYFEKWIAHEL